MWGTCNSGVISDAEWVSRERWFYGHLLSSCVKLKYQNSHGDPGLPSLRNLGTGIRKTFHGLIRIWPLDMQTGVVHPSSKASNRTVNLIISASMQRHVNEVHFKLCGINLLNVTPSLIYRNPREQMFLHKISLLIVMFPFHISWALTLKLATKKFKAHAHTHHVVIIVIITMLTLCYFIMSHVSPSLFDHASIIPTLANAGHQWTESTSTGCNQWLSLAKIALKVPHAGRNRSPVANTSRCGEGIRASPPCRVKGTWQAL